MVLRGRIVKKDELLLVNGLSPATERIPSPQAGVNAQGLAFQLETTCSGFRNPASWRYDSAKSSYLSSDFIAASQRDINPQEWLEAVKQQSNILNIKSHMVKYKLLHQVCMIISVAKMSLDTDQPWNSILHTFGQSWRSMRSDNPPCLSAS